MSALAWLLALAGSLCGFAALLRASCAESGVMSDMLSWPIQQLARARLYDEDRLTDAEKEAIDELMPGEAPHSGCRLVRGSCGLMTGA